MIYTKKLLFTTTLLLLLGGLSGCKFKQSFSPKNPDNAQLTTSSIQTSQKEKVTWDDLDGVFDDQLEEAFLVFQNGCRSGLNPYKTICKKAIGTEKELVTPKIARDFFVQNFDPYRLITQDKKEQGLITGYYEPLLFGSRTKSEQFPYPIYKTPKDLVQISLKEGYPRIDYSLMRGKLIRNKVIPYDTREMIEKRDDLEPLCFVSDKIALFFLHIQGSGRVMLDDNTTLFVGYDDQNGREYFAIGKQLIADKMIDPKDISLQTIEKWLKENPAQADQLMYKNQSYVFFKESLQSATGSLGVPLVAQRNIAVDRSVIPLGTPVFLETHNPITQEKIARIVIAADTGGAIKGEIRADYFWGFGKEAGRFAGAMKEDGSLTVLLPKEEKPLKPYTK